MAQSLEYASADTPSSQRRPPTVLRVMLWPLYYAGWAAGFAVVAILALWAIFRVADVHEDNAFGIGSIVGATTGFYLAFRARRIRWPHRVMLLVGSLTTIGFLLGSLRVYTGPRQWLWEIGLFICLSFAGLGACLIAAGIAGLFLAKRHG